MRQVNGWPDHVYGPSPIPWNEKHAKPIEMTKSDIENLKNAWVASVNRALTAGFDLIEIHNAHGYLLHSFLSPASNKRTDEYGGSFENRIRLTLEIVDLTRQAVPKDMPLFLRISATDWLEEQKDMESWKVEDTVRLAEILADRGIDLLDVSSGGNHPLQHPHTGPGYQSVSALLASLGSCAGIETSADNICSLSQRLSRRRLATRWRSVRSVQSQAGSRRMTCSKKGWTLLA